MAIKDWKKVRDSKKGFVFRKGNKEVFAHKTTRGIYFLFISDIKRTFSNRFSSNIFITTKSQALKFAKAYMRKH